MPKNEKTSKKVASQAAKILSSDALEEIEDDARKASHYLWRVIHGIQAYKRSAKSIAGSALTQAGDRKK